MSLLKNKIKIVLLIIGVSYNLNCFGVNTESSVYITQPTQKEYILKGRVVDENGQPLPGVTIIVKETNRGVVSDINGYYIISLKRKDYTLIFSFMGMETKQVKLSGQSKLNIVLKEKKNNLKEVVIVGLFNRKKESFTGSAATYTRKEIKMVGASNIVKSISALDPTIKLYKNNLRGSDPNTLPDIEIRGKTSVIGGISSEYEHIANQPLIILDGMEIELSTLVNIPLDRIESVTILKDAASTAVYGSKSANGVIVVETVKPKAGELRVSYNGTVKLQWADLSDYNLMNASEKLEYEKLAGRYTSTDGLNQDRLDKLYYSRLKAIKQGVNTDWIAQPVHTVLNHTQSVQIDGGDQSMLYGIGFSYANEDGVMKQSERKLMSGNVNLSYRKNNFVFTNYLTYDEASFNLEPLSFSVYARANPYYKMYEDNGSTPMLLESIELASDRIYNPLYLSSLANTNQSATSSIRNQFSIKYHTTKGLMLRGRFGISSSKTETKAFKSPNHPDFLGEEPDRKGLFSKLNDKRIFYNGDFIASYGKLFNETHRINASAGWSFSNKNSIKEGYTVSGFVGDKHRNPKFSAGFQMGDKPNYSNSISRSMSLFVNSNYAFKQRYLFDFSFRYDGSSVFGAQQMYSPTWAFGVGWNLHKEDFVEASWLTLLKLRSSIGNPGNQNFDAYMSSGMYKYNAGRTNPFGESAIITKFANPNLKWQRTLDFNIGVDIAFIDNRYRLSVDYYRKNTDPLLLSVTMPPSAGDIKSYTNLGAQLSTGISASVNLQIIKTDELKFNTHFTLLNNTNTYKNIGNSLDYLNEKGNAKNLRRYYENGSPDDIWAVRSLGIDPATGNEVFYKKDGTYSFLYDANDEVVVGSTNPNVSGIIGCSVYYKQFSFMLNMRYKYGGQTLASVLFNKVENISEHDLFYNLDKRALYGRWKNVGDKAPFKAIKLNETTPISSRFVLNDNQFNLESFSIGYDASPKWIQKYGVNGISFRWYMHDILRFSSVQVERGIDYAFSRSMSFSLGLRF